MSEPGAPGTPSADAAAAALKASNRLAETNNFAKFVDSVSSIAVDSIDRARASAELVQKASAAIAGLYTGVLALAFSVTDNQLPLRGVLAPTFLGLAVVLSTAYVAYMTPPGADQDIPIEPAMGLEPKSISWLRSLMQLTSRTVLRRSYALRAGVIALGVGLAYIALPFVSLAATRSGSVPATAWPAVPTTGDPELLKILYQAQVAEVAQQRAKEAVPPPTDDFGVTVACLVLGLVVVFVVPAFPIAPARKGSAKAVST